MSHETSGSTFLKIGAGIEVLQDVIDAVHGVISPLYI